MWDVSHKGFLAHPPEPTIISVFTPQHHQARAGSIPATPLPLPSPHPDANTSPCLFAWRKGARNTSSPSHPALIAEISGLSKPQGRKLGIYLPCCLVQFHRTAATGITGATQPGEPVPAPTARSTPELFPGHAQSPPPQHPSPGGTSSRVTFDALGLLIESPALAAHSLAAAVDPDVGDLNPAILGQPHVLLPHQLVQPGAVRHRHGDGPARAHR